MSKEKKSKTKIIANKANSNIMPSLAPSTDTFLPDIDLILDDNTGNSTIIFGSSKTGKSTLYLYLYSKYFEEDRNLISVLFSPNHHTLSKTWNLDDLPDRLLISSTYQPSIIKDFHTINHRTNNKYKFLVCMDDCVDNKNDINLKKLILTHRNANISSIVCLQDCTLLAKNQRNNANNIIFFKFMSEENILETIKRYFDSFLDRILPCRNSKPSNTQKIDWYRQHTEDHRFIYYNTRNGNFSFHRLRV
jgi:hypothetical protein